MYFYNSQGIPNFDLTEDDFAICGSDADCATGFSCLKGIKTPGGDFLNFDNFVTSFMQVMFFNTDFYFIHFRRLD